MNENLPLPVIIVVLAIFTLSVIGGQIRQKRNNRGLCGNCSCLLQADRVEVAYRKRTFTFCPDCGSRIKFIDRAFYTISFLIIVVVGVAILVFS